MEIEKTPVEDLLLKTKDYINTRIDLFKLKSIDKASTIVPSTLLALVLFGLFLLVLLFLSIGFALFLGNVLGAAHYGFFIVAGLYILIGLIFYSFRKSLLQKPFTNWLIKNLID